MLTQSEQLIFNEPLKFLLVLTKPVVLQMQMRFDGHVGFPGGLVEPGEDVVHGLIREMQEEINLDPQSNQVTSISVYLCFYS